MLQLLPLDNIKEISSLLWFKPNAAHMWLKISSGCDIIGIVELQPLTKVCVSLHIHFFKKFQNQGFGAQIEAPLVQFCKESGIFSIIGFVAEQNIPMITVANHTNFQLVSIIPNGVIWKDNVQNLLIYNRAVT